jgi:MYXO-CTERM domain-containing protein
MGSPFLVAAIALFNGLLTALPLRAATLTVGPGKMHAQPCAAIAAASDSDTIEIDAAGGYDGDVCAVPKNRLILRGVGGRPKIGAAGKNYGGKGIWVISGNDTTVENIEFSGAAVPDRNGAGIRQEGSNLTVRGCYFHDNENGILTGGGAGTEVVIEYSEFANNGYGDGFSHNMYIGHEGRFTLRYSYSHDAKVGHIVKSRAAENYILYNRLSGENGSASYELDLPNAGTSYVIGNLIEQGAATQNSVFVTYGVEGTTPENPGQTLFVVNNTFVNDRTAGGTFINVGGAITTPVVIINNIFLGVGTITTQASATQRTNFAQADPKLVDRLAYDYRLAPGSPCINAGSDPGMGAGFVLLPSRQYIHPSSAVDRTIEGEVDIGAYEFGLETDAGTDASDAASPQSPDASDAGPRPTDASGSPRASDASDTGAPQPPDASEVGSPRAIDASDAAAPEPPDVSDAGSSGLRDASEGGAPEAPDGAVDASGNGSGCSCRTAPGRDAPGGIIAGVALVLAVGSRRDVRERLRVAGRSTRVPRLQDGPSPRRRQEGRRTGADPLSDR